MQKLAKSGLYKVNECTKEELEMWTRRVDCTYNHLCESYLVWSHKPKASTIYFVQW